MIRVLIADDHEIMVEGLTSIVEDMDNITVVGKAFNGEEVLRFLRLNEVDIVIMDIGMPVLNGIDTTKEIKNVYNVKVKVLILSMHDSDGYIEDAVKAGVDGYILKNTAPDEMFFAIQELANGRTYYNQQVISKLTRSMGSIEDLKGIKLSEREREILPLICQGLKPKDIGDRLSSSKHTIVTYKRSLFNKFTVSTLEELVKKAVLKGFVRE